jgi:hypothetical protein
MTVKNGNKPAASNGAVPWVRLSEQPGAKLDLGVCRWPEGQGEPSYMLLVLLREATGSVRQSGAGGMRENEQPAPGQFRVTEGDTTTIETVEVAQGVWPTLAQLDPAVVLGLVRRVRRMHHGWDLDCPPNLSIVESIDVHFGRGQRRWQRERGMV